MEVGGKGELGGLCAAGAEDTLADGLAEVVALMGVIIVVGTAKLTLTPPVGEVTETWEGRAGAEDVEFMAESSQALIHASYA